MLNWIGLEAVWTLLATIGLLWLRVRFYWLQPIGRNGLGRLKTFDLCQSCFLRCSINSKLLDLDGAIGVTYGRRRPLWRYFS